jgi:hypothetical protein
MHGGEEHVEDGVEHVPDARTVEPHPVRRAGRGSTVACPSSRPSSCRSCTAASTAPGRHRLAPGALGLVMAVAEEGCHVFKHF